MLKLTKGKTEISARTCDLLIRVPTTRGSEQGGEKKLAMDARKVLSDLAR